MLRILKKRSGIQWLVVVVNCEAKKKKKRMPKQEYTEEIT